MLSPLGLGTFLASLLPQQFLNTGYSGTQDWVRLNETVGGRLFRAEPWPRPCFSSFEGQPVGRDAIECSIIQENFFNNHLNRSQQFGGYSATNHEMCMSTGDSCELDFTNPSNPEAFSSPAGCKLGNIPDFYIDVRGKEDVVAALNFSKVTGVPLVIKNTGHDFRGRSAGRGSLALWMHHMKYMSHEPDFSPEGCQTPFTKSAITFGAGQQFQEIYEFVDKLGLEMVGGSDQSVGAAGGWAQGGGHSSLTPLLGMGADRTLQYKVVTPDGVFRTANACQNEDLFWALRGGGGGTFGVVLEATMEVLPAKSYRIANINWPVGKDNLREVLSIVLANATTFALQGWGGYLTATAGNLILTTTRLNLEEANESMDALLGLTKRLGGASTISEVPTFLEWFNLYVQGSSGSPAAVGLPNVMASRLVPQKNHATPDGRSQMLDALMSAFDNTIFSQMHFTTPFGYKETDGSDTSVNPIWRTSLYQVILVNTWLFDATLEDRKHAYAQSSKAANFLRDITPDGGAYLNEADTYEPNYEFSFYNKNYLRLLEVKNKYDPDHLLDCWQCVGWKGASSPRYSCFM